MPFKQLAAFLLSLTLVGCSMAPSIDTELTNQPQASAQLQVIEHDDKSVAWKSSAAPFSAQHEKAVFINLPKTFSLNSDDPRLAKFEGDTNQLRQHFRRQLEQQLTGAGYRVINKPTAKALTLNVSLTDIKRAPRDPSVTEYIPIGMLIGLSLHATGVRDETLYLFFQSEVSDAVTGKMLGRAVDRADGKNLEQSASPTVEDIYPALDSAAQQIRERLDREFQPNKPA
ncbi:DUF3313 domain-containing protein [Pseudomonas plecoglossicida]|uniref:DUF3313 domain-containing protein n=1 Tax=Pseudomonas plecoglossicida TaxID=70775 RepID=A0AAD0VUH3_PSEDL|nr:DUF3313 domain-containing protein [Pseudomonas plecoglossicida]AXM97453.1 DUF3313 domain-containing protein [Pseudomonas plecoglossicida]EPB94770.1 hypothetical protein L321_16173 [Pseudomonas plecoglossicida NB2011]QLB57768.1 DUF3313 domain-containing protein [Pseudomonas plecoglossicida]GLR36959.1 hypothetical protein GCM10011247_23560 [Pseudomonas plecoglossicida]